MGVSVCSCVCPFPCSWQKVSLPLSHKYCPSMPSILFCQEWSLRVAFAGSKVLCVIDQTAVRSEQLAFSLQRKMCFSSLLGQSRRLSNICICQQHKFGVDGLYTTCNEISFSLFVYLYTCSFIINTTVWTHTVLWMCAQWCVESWMNVHIFSH